MKLIYLLCVLLAFAYYAECKKGGGGGRVGGKGGWFWRSNNKKTHSSSNKKHHNSQPEPPPKQSQPSAPHPEPSFKKETAGVQQSSFQKNSQPHQTPVGWNVPGTNQNNPWKNTAYQQHGAPGGYHPQGGWPSSGAGYHGYPQQHGGAWGNGYHGSPGGAWGGGYHGAPGGYHGFSNGHSGYPQNSYGGFGGYHPSSSYGGFGGGFGGFGGNRGGFGGYGGMGGFGGPMVIQKKSGFGSTFGNILTGMAIYSLGSSLLGGMFRRPYNVYNYHNQPEKREEIQMPSNILTICEGNATSFCIKGTTAICTSNGTVLCVATMSNTSPCGEGGALCINTTVPCVDKSDPLCQNATKQQEEIPINLPCFTNLTVDVNLLHEEGPANANHKYCVTTMAIAGPEYKNCSQDGKKAVEGYRSVLEGTFNWSIIVENIKRPYIVYNFEHPTEASAGDIVMPLQVLAPCIDNATNLCAPGLTPVCTSFAEVMCLEVSSSLSYCEAYNTTCFQSTIPCVGDDDDLCKNATTSEETEETANKTEITLDLPCFTNITINSNLPNFDIHNFNGTIPQGSPTSFMYHYHFCVITLALPSAETEVCIM